MTEEDIYAALRFDQLPPDEGIITPIASAADRPDSNTAESVGYLAQALPDWAPGSLPDPVQRVRNLLYVAAVPDLLQMDVERYVPAVIFARLQTEIPSSTLIKILYWIAVHPFDGDDQAAADLSLLGLPRSSVDSAEMRARAAVYGVKLLGRLVGRIDQR